MIIDASVVLATLFDEPGGEALLDHPRTCMSAVNWSEVVQKARGQDIEGWLTDLGVEVVPFDRDDADAAAALFPHTQRLGLSLADRACLALAQRRGEGVLTADRAWAEVDGIDIRLVR